MESYPLVQQYIEPLGNAFWKEVTGTDLDMWIGPRTWKKELSDYFINYDGKYGDKWDSIFIPVMNIIADGYKVKGVEIDYVHPKIQTEIEEKLKDFNSRRVDQYNSLTMAILKHANAMAYDGKYLNLKV